MHSHATNVHQCIYLYSVSITPAHEMDYKSPQVWRMKQVVRKQVGYPGDIRKHTTDEAV